jgi:uncharacterized membrane protein YbhN (UPF0104 family)
MAIDDDKLYEELGRAWLHYVVWREKIFGGYLSVLAALGYGFSKVENDLARAAVFASAIVVSIVFWMLDFRTNQLVNTCQLAADQMTQSKGFYGALNRTRFARRSGISYGTAISTLVASVVGIGAAGMLHYMQAWALRPEHNCWDIAIVATALVVASVVQQCLTRYSGHWWQHERKKYKTVAVESGSSAKEV